MMRVHLIAPACLALLAAAPAAALSPGASPPGAHAGRHHGDGRDHGGWRDGGRRHRDGRNGDVVVGYWDNGDWARYNNRAFEPDSYNDWWHERPERSLPRWVTNNQNCERMYWTGGGWRC